MKKFLLLLCLASGCSPSPPPHMDVLCDCFATAAYDAYRSELLASVEPEKPQKCCGQCGKNGLPPGKMLSGDKLSVVPCPCPETCPCKSKSCTSGTCRRQP